MNNKEFQVNKEFLQFKGKDVLVELKNNEEYEGNVVTIDNFLNTVLKLEDGNLKVIKGEKIVFISIKK
ncbi:MAG: LSM domain-containing protein [Methanobrevibacter sp.]